LAKFTEATIQLDIIEKNYRARFSYFKTIKTHIARSDFLTCNLTFSEIRIIQQLRTGIPRMRVKKYIIELNGIWGLWKREGKPPICESCNSGKLEDFYHVMYECDKVYNERLKYLYKYSTKLNINRENYIIIMFENAREEDYKNICNFWVAVEKIKNAQ